MKQFAKEILAEKKMLYGLVLLWLVPSAVALGTISGEWFAACGAVGIVASLVFVGRVILTQRWAIQTRRLADMDNRISIVQNENTISICEQKLAWGSPDSESLLKIKSSVQKELAELTKLRGEAKSGVHMKPMLRHEKALVQFETFILCAATVQWGFGELFVNYFCKLVRSCS
ncbi:hypothetical protein [Marivita sp.]|uniref:hypothetical protein n=1 Tax=Marivita sp. TaxID=2003365 RepID=UPI00321BED72